MIPIEIILNIFSYLPIINIIMLRKLHCIDCLFYDQKIYNFYEKFISTASISKTCYVGWRLLSYEKIFKSYYYICKLFSNINCDTNNRELFSILQYYFNQSNVDIDYVIPSYNKELNPISAIIKCASLDLRDRNLRVICHLDLLIYASELVLSNNKIRKIQNLDLIQLEILDLSNNHITIVENLDQMTNLKFLSLSYNNIVSCKNINNLKNILSLDLNYNKLHRIPDMSNLVNLQSLNLSNNMIKTIKNIGYLPNLEELRIFNNRITKIKNLYNPELHKLFLSYNKIIKIKNLYPLINLEYLDLNNNNISRIENLDKLTKLKYLNLSKNNISKIENLDNLVNLYNLNLSYNQITIIENLKNLKNIRVIDLSFNKIQNIDHIFDINLSKQLNPSSRCIDQLLICMTKEYLSKENLKKLNNVKIEIMFV